MKLSAIIIAKNEESRIAKCLSHLTWVDEVIVVDNGSTDATREVAKKQGATVISVADTHDFAKLRTIGKEKAHGEWLLYVDADEVVTQELAGEIREVVSHQESRELSSSGLTRGSSSKNLDSRFRGNDNLVGGYEFRRKNYYLGHPWPGEEYILRLMRKDALQEWYGELHETARVKGEIGRLRSPLFHYTHRTLEEMVTKTNEWSQSEANLRFLSGHPQVVWWRFLRVMLTAFFDSFIRQSGWRAGAVGWIESIYQAFSMFITYAKLWEMQQREKL